MFKAIITIAPIAFMLEGFNIWFNNNHSFITAVIWVIMINMIVGAFTNYYNKSFNWEKFFIRTSSMVAIIITTYFTIELIISVANKNAITNGFETIIQIATLLYPGSKVLKNMYILSRGEYPPKWLMEKIYNFQENGDLKELGKITKKETLDNTLKKE